LIFGAVNAANAVLAVETDSKRWLSLSGVALCVGALISLLWQAAKRSPNDFFFPFVMIAVSFSIEVIFRLTTRRKSTTKSQKGLQKPLTDSR